MTKEEQEKQRAYFKKLADDWIRGLIVKYVPEYPATLFLDGQIFATGLAAVEDDRVTFCPEPLKKLDDILRGKVTLKVWKTAPLLELKHSFDLLGISCDRYWAFEKVA